jgi:multiple sugar transport system substrate-binding protein
MYKVYKRFALMVALLIIAVPFLAACGGDNPTATPVPAPTNTTAPVAAPTDTTAPVAAATDTVGTTAAATATTGSSSSGKSLQIIWFDWAPCQALTNLSKSFPGAAVSVRCVPIGEWHSSIFTDFAAKQGADVVILDSQFIGEAVAGGHIMDLTDWMKTNIETDDYVPAALAAYGEYPAGSGKYYGVAAEGDTQMIVYRKDVFAAAAADYKAKTGKDLVVPTKWTDLLAIAQFIKANPGKYGDVQNGYTTFYCGTVACYDQIATHWNQILWSMGGELWDPATYKVQGFINSDTAVKALDFDKELFKTGPDGQGNFQFNETVDALCSGTTAMTTIWFGFGSAFVDTKGCKHSADLAYAAAPGEDKHFISLGGMGLHVSSYTKDKDLALEYVKWFESKETQLEWAKLGGFSARKSVLASDEFKNAAPYNPAFADAYQYVKDFWNIPEYNSMLQVQMEQLNLAVTGQEDSKTALDTIATKQQQVLDEAYPNGPPKQ